MNQISREEIWTVLLGIREKKKLTSLVFKRDEIKERLRDEGTVRRRS